ncbi:MAG: GxxExxY protein [Desulfobacterales bacterium]
MEKDALTGRIIGCAIDVHRNLGPGLLESTYKQCLAHELYLNGLKFKLECGLPVQYKGIKLDCGYRVDILVENRVIIEIKSVTELMPVHQAQILTYMKLASISTGLLINFNVTKLTNAIKRFAL